MTTRTACWISRCRRSADAAPDAAPKPRRPPGRDAMPRVTDILGHEGLIEPRTAGRRRPGRPDARAAAPSPPRATCACRRWRAAMRGFCSRWAIPPSAATAITIRSSAKSAWARSPSRSCRRNSASPSRSATSSLTECQMVNQFAGSKTEPPQFTRGYGLVLRPWRAQGHGAWRWSTAPCAPRNWART